MALFHSCFLSNQKEKEREGERERERLNRASLPLLEYFFQESSVGSTLSVGEKVRSFFLSDFSSFFSPVSSKQLSCVCGGAAMLLSLKKE